MKLPIPLLAVFVSLSAVAANSATPSNLFDADGLSGKDLAEVDLFVAQTDCRASGVGTRGRLVDFGRTFHIQSRVRTLVVEDVIKCMRS